MAHDDRQGEGTVDEARQGDDMNPGRTRRPTFWQGRRRGAGNRRRYRSNLPSEMARDDVARHRDLQAFFTNGHAGEMRKSQCV